MSLQYNILWLDDRIEEYQTLEIDTELKEYVEDLFFEPHIYMYESVDEAVQNSIKRKYDVIFSDYNINENKTGKDFIVDIRNKNINAEVLFYSAQQTPPETGLDRISFLKLHSDNSYEDLKNKMKSVINLTVEKLKDLTNLRGLVMSEVSELDNKMEQLISDYFLIENDTARTKRRKLFDDNILQHIENKTKEKLKSINCKTKTCQLKLKDRDINKIIHSIDFDSSYKAYTIDFIMKELAYSFSQGEFKDIYILEINQKRNDLAHSYSEIENGEEILKTKKHGPQKFTKDDIADIRRDIRKYHLIFNELDKLIEEKNREIIG